MKKLLLIVLIAGCGSEAKETFMVRFNRDPELYIRAIEGVRAKAQDYTRYMKMRYPSEE